MENLSAQNTNEPEVYDKAKWYLECDPPFPKKKIINHFKIIFDFLKEKDLLNEEGLEDYEFNRSEEDIFWAEQIKEEAHYFFHNYYDALVQSADYGSEQFRTNLIQWYAKYEEESLGKS